MKINIKKIMLMMARNCINDSEMLKKAGIPFCTWYQIKNGKCTPKPATIGKIAKALGVDVTEILEEL